MIGSSPCPPLRLYLTLPYTLTASPLRLHSPPLPISFPTDWVRGPNLSFTHVAARGRRRKGGRELGVLEDGDVLDDITACFHAELIHSAAGRPSP